MSNFGSLSECNYAKVTTNNEESVLAKEQIPDKYGFGTRHVQLIIFFLCLTMSFIARGHLGVTIVAMTSRQNEAIELSELVENFTDDNQLINRTKDENANSGAESVDRFNVTTTDDAISAVESNSTEQPWSVYRTFDWPKPIQEMVLTSFFVGYCIMTLPMALVCQRWGGKVPLQLSMLVNGIVSLSTPLLALWGGWQALCICRLLQGFSQAGTYPGIQTLVAQWIPSSELATLSSYLYTGSTVGTIIGFQIGGLLSDAMGWPATYWMIGLLCLITFVFLTVFGASSPRVHKRISEEEKRFIVGHSNTGVTQKTRIPWKAILSSKPMWASFATQVGSGVSFTFFLTQVPSYIHNILGIDVKNSGVLSSLPYIAGIFSSLAFGVVSDFFTNRNILSIKTARRISNTIAQVGVAGTMICASYVTSTTLVVTCFVVCNTCYVGIHTGFMVNQIDLAPNLSGSLMAIGNTLTNAAVVVLPVLVSYIVVDMKNVYQWRIMLYLVAGVTFFTNLIFVFFISVDVQPWNEGHLSETKLEDVKDETTIKKETNE